MASIAQNSNVTVSAPSQDPCKPDGDCAPRERSDKSAAAIVTLQFRGQPHWKRVIDLTIVAIVTISMLPLIIATAVVIRLGSRGPVFFRQTRIGAMGRPFTIWKFRTMFVQASEGDHTEYVRQQIRSDKALNKLDRRSELVPLGGLIRRLTIDELPQLINIFLGEMSVVGPRPDVIELTDYEPAHLRRFEVVPGVTGLWQVNGKNNTTFTEMMNLDAEYVARRSLLLDLKILAMTPLAVVRQAIAKSS